MKVIVNNNQIKTKDMTIPATGIIPEVAAVRNVRVSNVQDAEGNPSNVVEAIRYDCVDPNTYACFTIKVEGGKPVVTEEVLEASPDVVYIQIPVSEVSIKPYEIKYGIAKVSIVAPFVKLVQD